MTACAANARNTCSMQRHATEHLNAVLQLHMPHPVASASAAEHASCIPHLALDGEGQADDGAQQHWCLFIYCMCIRAKRTTAIASRTFCSRLSFLFFCTLLPLPRFFTTTAKTPFVFIFLAFVASESMATGPEAAKLSDYSAAPLMITTLSIECTVHPRIACCIAYSYAEATCDGDALQAGNAFAA